MELYFSNCSLRIPVGPSNTPALITPGLKVPAEAIANLSQQELESLLAGRKIVKVISTPKGEKPQGFQIPQGSWSFKPEELEGKSLEQLNMMILDHVLKHGLKAVEPFTTIEEATHFMGHALPRE